MPIVYPKMLQSVLKKENRNRDCLRQTTKMVMWTNCSTHNLKRLWLKKIWEIFFMITDSFIKLIVNKTCTLHKLHVFTIEGIVTWTLLKPYLKRFPVFPNQNCYISFLPLIILNKKEMMNRISPHPFDFEGWWFS